MSSSDDDSDCGPPAKKVKTTALPPCPYAAKCYRKNPAHFAEYSHPKPGAATTSPAAVKPSTSGAPGDSSGGTKHIDTSKLPVCPFGAGCYRKNLLHFAEFSHPYTGGGAADLPEDDSGSDTDVMEDDEEEEDTKNAAKPKLKRGPSLIKNYSQMNETERRDLIKQAFEAKQQLEKELAETKKQVAEKDKELEKLQDEVNTGILLVDGEKEALEGDKTKYFELLAERAYKEGSADQIHFRLAESQFYRLLASGFGATAKIKKVEYVVNPVLSKKFKEAREHLKKNRGEDYSYPVLAFHGTQETNINPIVETGFKVPGSDGFTHRTDTGYYGAGVYFSEYPSYSMGYIAGSTKLLLCQVLQGKTFQCTTLIHGASLQKGHDSHMSPCKKELVIFNKYHILPSYIVHYSNSNTDFKYIKPKGQRRVLTDKADLMKLYWKAAKTKKSAILCNWTFKLTGKQCDTIKNLETLIKKHGGFIATGAAGHFNILVTTENDFKKNGTWVKKANALAGSFCVRQEFIYDCIVKKDKMEPEDYSFD